MCFLPARSCPEAVSRAQDVVASFQRLQAVWADAELALHGRLLSATMRALPQELPILPVHEQQKLMQVSHQCQVVVM